MIPEDKITAGNMTRCETYMSDIWTRLVSKTIKLHVNAYRRPAPIELSRAFLSKKREFCASGRTIGAEHAICNKISMRFLAVQLLKEHLLYRTLKFMETCDK